MPAEHLGLLAGLLLQAESDSMRGCIRSVSHEQGADRGGAILLRQILQPTQRMASLRVC